MKLRLSQSKIYSSLNFREALQPQSVNKFTLDVCTPSRLLKQSHKFCTQRAEAHLSGATQRTLLYEGGIRDLGNYGLRDLNSPLSASVERKISALSARMEKISAQQSQLAYYYGEKKLCVAIIDCSLLSA